VKTGIYVSILCLASLGISTSTATREAAAESLCVQCHEDCPVGWHLAANAGTYTLPVNWYRNGGAHLDGLCRSGTCSTKHGPQDCEEPPPFAAIDRAIMNRDGGEVRRLVESHSKYLAVNVDRGAIQVSNCTGHVVAHIPIDSNLLAVTD
jgi:hypothetical protein